MREMRERIAELEDRLREAKEDRNTAMSLRRPLIEACRKAASALEPHAKPLSFERDVLNELQAVLTQADGVTKS